MADTLGTLEFGMTHPNWQVFKRDECYATRDIHLANLHILAGTLVYVRDTDLDGYVDIDIAPNQTVYTPQGEAIETHGPMGRYNVHSTTLVTVTAGAYHKRYRMLDDMNRLFMSMEQKWAEDPGFTNTDNDDRHYYRTVMTDMANRIYKAATAEQPHGETVYDQGEQGVLLLVAFTLQRFTTEYMPWNASLFGMKPYGFDGGLLISAMREATLSLEARKGAAYKMSDTSNRVINLADDEVRGVVTC